MCVTVQKRGKAAKLSGEVCPSHKKGEKAAHFMSAQHKIEEKAAHLLQFAPISTNFDSRAVIFTKSCPRHNNRSYV